MASTDTTKTVAELGVEPFAGDVIRPEGTWVREEADKYRLHVEDPPLETLLDGVQAVAQVETEGGPVGHAPSVEAAPAHQPAVNVRLWLMSDLDMFRADGTPFKQKVWERIAFLVFCNDGQSHVTLDSIGQKPPGLGGHKRGLSVMEAVNLSGFSGAVEGLKAAGVDAEPELNAAISAYEQPWRNRQAEMDQEVNRIMTE